MIENHLLEDIPKEFQNFEKKITTLDSGISGKTGILKLSFEKNNTGKTILTEQFSKVPLYSQRVLHYDKGNPEMAYLFIMSPSGGILQGDRYYVDVNLRNNAIVNLTTQGATRIYKMDSNYASQLINFNVGKDCYLEYVPDQIIPYKNSRYYQKVSIISDPSSTVVYSEIVTPGRVAMGEFFSYDICYLKTIAKDNQGKVNLIDVSSLIPNEQNLNRLGVLDGNSVFGSLYILTSQEHLFSIKDSISDYFTNNQKIKGGCSVLANNCGLFIRILGNDTEVLKTIIFEILRIIRKRVLNSSFDEIRKL